MPFTPSKNRRSIDYAYYPNTFAEADMIDDNEKPFIAMICYHASDEIFGEINVSKYSFITFDDPQISEAALEDAIRIAICNHIGARCPINFESYGNV